MRNRLGYHSGSNSIDLLTEECAARCRLLHVRLMAVVSNLLVTCCHL